MLCPSGTFCLLIQIDAGPETKPTHSKVFDNQLPIEDGGNLKTLSTGHGDPIEEPLKATSGMKRLGIRVRTFMLIKVRYGISSGRSAWGKLHAA